MRARAIPVTGCKTTAVAANTISARKTSRPTDAIIRTSPVRCARSKKNAMPAPVPISIVVVTTYIHLTNKYQEVMSVARSPFAYLGGYVPSGEFRLEIGQAENP